LEDKKSILIDNVKDNPNNLDVITMSIIDFDNEFYTLKTIVDKEQNLMDVLQGLDFHMGHCGGMALCASCHCYIESYASSSVNLSTEEEDMLDQLHNFDPEKSRLICQIPMSNELDGILIKIARD